MGIGGQTYLTFEDIVDKLDIAHVDIVKVKNNGKKVILQSPEEPWVWPLPRFKSQNGP